jgi:transcription-repair coupling factor (superfamily II helicase)
VPHPSLLDTFRKTPSFRELMRSLPARASAVAVEGLVGSTPAVMTAALHREAPERLWAVVTATPEAAEHLVADIESLLGEGSALLYPQRESLPYESTESHVEIGGLRVEVLEALLTRRASVLVTTQRAIQERSPAGDRLDDLQIELSAGSEARPAELIRRLEAMGFERVSTVEEVGHFAARGGILDVFGFGTPEPARIEFWGDRIESIRRFDVLTQLSTGEIERLRILPVDVRFAPPATVAPASATALTGARRSVLSYLPPDAVLIRVDAGPGEGEWDRTWTEVRRLYDAERLTGSDPEPPEQVFAPPSEVIAEIATFPQIFAVPGGSPIEPRIVFDIATPEPIDRDMPRLGEILRDAGRRGERTLILCDNDGQLDRLQELLADLKVDQGVSLTTGSLTGGFILREANPVLRVLTDHEIFRRTRRLRRRRQFRGGAAIESFAASKRW